jgi:hypothetical protein
MVSQKKQVGIDVHAEKVHSEHKFGKERTGKIFTF